MNLFIFHHIVNEPIISALLKFRETMAEEDYFFIAQGLIDYGKEKLTESNIIKEYVLRTMLEKDGLPDIASLRDFLRHDIKNIYNELFDIDWDELFHSAGFLPLSQIATNNLCEGFKSYSISLKSMLDCSSSEALVGAILAHVESFGTGVTTAYGHLLYKENRLLGIKSPDNIQIADISGVSNQKEKIIANTDAFITGYEAKNLLLIGGLDKEKPACVKACANLFKDSGLRLIKLNKEDIASLPYLFGKIDNKLLKYIIFINDLDEVSFNLLKNCINGGMEKHPENVLVYGVCNDCSVVNDMDFQDFEIIDFSK